MPFLSAVKATAIMSMSANPDRLRMIRLPSRLCKARVTSRPVRPFIVVSRKTRTSAKEIGPLCVGAATSASALSEVIAAMAA